MLRVGLQPLAIGGGDDLDPRPLDPFPESLGPLPRRRGGLQPGQLYHVPLPTQQFDHLFPRLAPDQLIIAADEAGKLIPFNLPVQHDHRNLRLDRLGHGRGERLGFLGADDDQIHALRDKLPHLRLLRLGLIGGVAPLHGDFRMLFRRGLDIRIHLHPPRLPQITLRHPDDKMLPGRGRDSDRITQSRPQPRRLRLPAPHQPHHHQQTSHQGNLAHK